MAKQLYNAQGRAIALPETLEGARKHRRPHYAGAEACPVCEARGYDGMITRKRYTATGGCVHCATLAALELHSLATYDGALDVPGDGRLLYVIMSDQTEREISEAYFDQLFAAAYTLFPENEAIPITPAGAAEKGSSLYIREKPCSRAGHLGVRQDTGECYYCALEKAVPSPRQEAIKAGDKEYLPLKACPHCGERALKSIASGQCLGCNPRADKDARETPDSLMMREAPDLIVSRKDAKALGFKVYRTGEACRKGHRGFRYISTGNCLSCRG